MQYNIVLFSMSSFKEWESGVVNRNYFIVRELLKHKEIAKILLVNYLPSTFKRGARIMYENIFFASGKIIKSGIFSKVYAPSERLRVLSTAWNLFSVRLFESEVAEAARNFLGKEPFIVWSYYPLDVSYYDFLRTNMGSRVIASVFDAVDDWSAHTAYSKKRKKLKKNYAYIERACDIIFTVSRSLKERLFHNAPNAHVIENGIDLAHFQRTTDVKLNIFQDIPKPIVGYVGIIEQRVDFALIEYLARKNAGLSFVFIGDVWKNADAARVKKLKNVYFLGRIPYQNIPRAIKEFSVAIVPHRVSPLTLSMNPLKIYEYLASGVKVVSTPIAMSDECKKWVFVAESEYEFDSLLKQCVQTEKTVFNSDLEKFLQTRDWSHIADNMMIKINKHFIT